ncbi:TetR-like C-terminal domain-containing protein [Hirschia litorea]|uniref:TetR-like C-terminal domain-containing protein n=1 Tax=Hirschia litorea TaxID=1199156 RepID=A0ABW2INI3_9PROT
MTETTSKPKAKTTARRAGPKRSEVSRLAVQNSALKELVENGWRSFSVDRVAKNAKASKQTIYRWWATPACMVVEAALETLPKSEDPNTTPEERILALISPLFTTIRNGDGAHMWRGILLAAADDEEAGEIFRKWVMESIRKPLRFILAEQANKGLIRRDWEIDFALESLLGPLWHRIAAMRAPLPDGYAERVTDALMTNLKKDL